MEMLAEFLKLSPITMVVLGLIVGSIVFMPLYLLSLLIRAVLGTFWKRETPQQDTKRVDELGTSTPAPRENRKPGVSLKTLMKSAAKSETSAADKHKSVEHFVKTLKGHTDTVNGLAFSPDGRALATACDDRTLRVYKLGDPFAKTAEFRTVNLKKGMHDVAFGADAAHVAVQTKGLAGAAGLMMLDLSAKGDAEVVWEVEGVHAGALPRCLRSSGTSKGGIPVVASCSQKADIRLFRGDGTGLGTVNAGGLENYTMALSRDGRFLAAATFTPDVKIYEMGFDRMGSYTGVRKAMDLKGHKAKVLCLAFSPDGQKAVTASADGTLKIWNINVRYEQDEDPKLLATAGLPLMPGKCYSQLAWGPDGHIAAVHNATIHFLEGRSGDLVASIEEAHDDKITCMEWSCTRFPSPGGQRISILATGSDDGKVRVWQGPRLLI